MAKQTFTTGQVLTAAQVTALQTNGYNQTVTTVTTNYTLLAADVGTRVYMNAAGATTITVNTGLFAAGDTLWLGNIGAGSCVVTAGTATVSKFSTASLTLSQYQGAFLYFVSTGVAILYSDSAGSSTPLTTKGDLYGFSTLDARVPIGANDTVLTADSTQSLGLKWAAAASPSYGWTAFTPVVKQGTTTFTVDANSAKSITIGKFVTVFWYTTIATGTGQSNTEIQVYVPTTAQITNFNTGLGYGTINIYDSSNSYAFYAGTGIGYQPDRIFIASGQNVATEEWGKTGSEFPIQLAAGDIIAGTISYQTA